MAGVRGRFDVLLPVQVISEARRHVYTPSQRATLNDFLSDCAYEELPMPSAERVAQNADLVRGASDVPIALALLDAGADILVTSDRDFTDAGATASRFSEQIQVMLPAVFLRQVLGWSSDELEAIRRREWKDFPERGAADELAP